MSTHDESARGGAPAPHRAPPPAATAQPVPRAVAVENGPLLVEGPLEIVQPDGTTRLCERPVIALCMCRRSLRAPFCDTSHRPRLRRTAARETPFAGGPATEGAADERPE